MRAGVKGAGAAENSPIESMGPHSPAPRHKPLILAKSATILDRTTRFLSH
jgi:hypothetical protein